MDVAFRIDFGWRSLSTLAVTETRLVEINVGLFGTMWYSLCSDQLTRAWETNRGVLFSLSLCEVPGGVGRLIASISENMVELIRSRL